MPIDDWENLPGRLFVVSGPSGVGKSTLANRLVQYPGLRARISISATTRSPRPGERVGIHYDFLTREEFEAARDRGAFLEWAEVHGNLYGTPAEPVRALLAEGVCVILVIDVQGGLQVRERVPNALLAFVYAPSLDVLESRLRARGTDDDATILRRLANARRELDVASADYPIQVLNDDLDLAVSVLVSLMKESGCGG